MRLRTVVSILFLLVPMTAWSQVGIQRLGSFDGGPDIITLSGLNVHFEIPIYSQTGRGRDTDVRVVTSYDGNVPLAALAANAANFSGGSVLFGGPWSEPTLIAEAGTVNVSTLQYSCGKTANGQPYGYAETRYFYIYSDQHGAQHAFGNGYSTDQACQYSGTPHLTTFAAATVDGSGFNISASGPTATITTPSGSTFYQYGLHQTAQDSNGNKVDALMGSDAYHNLSVQSLTSTTGTKITLEGGGFPSGTAAVAQSPLVLAYTDSNGDSQTVTLSYGLYQIDAQILGRVGGPPSVPASLLNKVSYPDGTFYAIRYATDPTGYYTGGISSITLPTGGVISYQWSSSETSPTAFTETLKRITSDGTTTYAWSSPGETGVSSSGAQTISQTTITYPTGEKTIVNFVSPLLPTSVEPPSDNLNDSTVSYETSRYEYGTQSALTRSSMKCYNGATGDCTKIQIIEPVLQVSDTVTLQNAQPSKITTSFNSVGLVTEQDEYDYGATAVTRKTVTTYASLGNNIKSQPQSVTVEDGTGSPFSKVTYGYDEYTLSGLSLVPTADLMGHEAVTGSRGNPTSQHAWILTSNISLDTHWQYDDAGQNLAVEDPRLSWTRYGYDPTTGNCLSNTTYPTPSSGVKLATSAVCDPNTGLRTTSTDLNGAVTSFSYDSMLRPSGSTLTSSSGNTIIGSAVEANNSVVYSDSSLPETIRTTITAAPSPDEVSTTTLDGFGRTVATVAPSGATVTTTYDSRGRVASVSNPYFSTSDSSYGITATTYDALGRQLLQCQPDNGTAASSCAAGRSYLQWTYTGNVVDYYDEARRHWQQTYDALGRLTKVLEPDGSTNIAGAPTLETDYTYDVLNNLLSATQWGGPSGTAGARTRTFHYDSLSRLTNSCNPEALPTTSPACLSTGPWSETYTYDANGNVHTRTDATPLTTTYTYDTLNRVTAKQYGTTSSSFTLNSYYAYDGAPSTSNVSARKVQPDGVGFTGNPIGRLSVSWTSPSQSNAGSTDPQLVAERDYYYDALGRVVDWGDLLSLPGNATAIGGVESVTYDLAGDVIYTAINSVAGTHQIIHDYTYDAGGQLLSIKLNSNSVGIPATIPSTVFQAIPSPTTGGPAYSAIGLEHAELSVNASGQPVMYYDHSFDNRLRPTYSTYTTGRGAASDPGSIPYSYQLAYTTSGIVSSAADSIVGTISATSTDNLKRLTSATYTTGAYAGLNFSWTYDAFGNRTGQTVSGSSSTPVPTTQRASYGSNNHITGGSIAPAGFSYDKVGNVVFDGLNHYAYDAENRLCAAQVGTSYVLFVYDAEGNRLGVGGFTPPTGSSFSAALCNPLVNGFSIGTAYHIGLGGEEIEGYTAGGAWHNTNIFNNGVLIATYDASNYMDVVMTDWLGTRRAKLPNNASIANLTEYLSLPFGDGWTAIGGNGLNDTAVAFTGKQHDNSTTGLENFLARYYSGQTGRFMSPDPSGLFYADPTNPQSLNLYSYVLNNPLVYVDPDGEFCYSVNPANNTVTVDNQAQSSADCSKGSTWVDGTANSYGYGSDGVLQIGYQGSNSGATGVLGFASPDVSMDSSGNLSNPWMIDLSDKTLYNTDTFRSAWGPTSGAVNMYNSRLVPRTRWCGFGGGGPPTNADDVGCRSHDRDFGKAGVSAAMNMGQGTPTKAQFDAMKAANQKLYDTVTGHPELPQTPFLQLWLTGGVGHIYPGTEAKPSLKFPSPPYY